MLRWFYVAQMVIRSMFTRRAFEEQLDADVRFHLDQATAEYLRQGLSPEEARRAAVKAFGNPALIKEDVREMSMWIWWERLAQDLRYGFRSFRRTPVLVATAVLSLAIGIGATTAVFSMFNTLVLRPIPVRDPERLFQVVHRGEAGSSESSAYALYAFLRDRAQTIEGAFQVDPTSRLRVLVDGEAEAVVGEQVTGDYFNLLGVQPVVGRLIAPHDEGGSSRNAVVVLSHAYWTRRFGGAIGVVGRTITIDEEPHTIIGVAAPDYSGLQVGRRADVSVPIDGTIEPQFWKSRALVVRLARGVSRDAALADLNVLFQQYLANDKTISDRTRAQAFQSLDLAPASAGLPEFRDRYGRPVQATLAIVFLLLVLGCANLASLFLARASTRQRDISVSLALGASRARLARQMLAETLVISMAGGALGVLAGSWGVEVLVGFLPDFAGTPTTSVGLDKNVLLFGLLLTMITGTSIGLGPAVLARRVDIRHMLSAGGPTLARGGGAFKALILLQVMLSTVLVVAALLFTVTLRNLKNLPVGFVADGVLTLTVDADGSGVEGPRLAELHRQMLEALRALPGVQSATFATIPPLSSNEDGKGISIPGMTFPLPEDGVLQVNTIGPDFFDTFGVRIVKGRGITAADHESAPQVAVVSESMARYYFPGLDPIGRRMDVGRGRTGGQIEIVGVAGDVHYESLRTRPRRMVYVAAVQREAEEEVVFAVRAASDPAALAEAARREVQAVAPAMLTTNVKTLADERDETLANERLLAALSGCFGGLALLLAAIGVYGLVAYSITQRTAELGLRLALGARRLPLLWLIVRGTLALVVVAGLLGVLVAFLTGSLLSSLLFGIQPAELWVYSTTLAILIAVGLLSTAGPTLRTLRINPVETLRGL